MSAAPETPQNRGAEQVSSICSECGAPLHFPLGSVQVQCEHCEAGLVVEQGRRLVRLHCPRCAGNFFYLDGAMCGQCPYCDAALLAVSHGRVLRFVVRPAEQRPDEAVAAGAELLLVPFWHLSGMLYGWDMGSRVVVEQDRDSGSSAYGSEVDVQANMPRTTRRDSGPTKAFRGRVVDVTVPDPVASALGVVSLRYRAAVFPLEPFEQRHEQLGKLLPPAWSPDVSRETLWQRGIRTGAPTEGMTRLDCQRVDLVSEELALYYYPFWLARTDDGPLIWDGVSGQPERLGSPVEPPAERGGGVYHDLRVLELTCAACNAQLPPGNHSRVIPCTSCGAFWRVEPEGLQRFEAQFTTAADTAAAQVWLPYWYVPCVVRFGGKECSKISDLRNTLGVLKPPGDITTCAPDDPLGFFVPAYGALTMPKLDFAARDMSRLQPLLRPGKARGGDIGHCFYGPQDAQRLAYVSWILLIPGTVPHRIRSLRVQVGDPELWYVPFAENGRELTNLLTGINYDKVAFRGLRH